MLANGDYREQVNRASLIIFLIGVLDFFANVVLEMATEAIGRKISNKIRT